MEKLFNPLGAIIEEDGKLHQVKSILTDGEVVFSNFEKRALVLILCQNSYESIFFYINALERGIVPILIDSRSDFSIFSDLIAEYQPDYIFAPAIKQPQFENFTLADYFKTYIILKNNRKYSKPLFPELALLLSTSGTTGSAKLVRLSYSNLLSNACSISKFLNLNNSEIAISSLPMNYSFGLSIINSHLYVGGSIVMTEESLTQRRFWELFKDFKVTSLSGVPYTYEILKKFRLLNSELPSLKTLTQAGGKLSNDLVEYFSNISKSKGLNFFVMYGQTEGTARLSYLNPELVQEKLGSIGRPIPGGDFFLIDDRGNKINKALVSGELVYTGANVMLGYSFCLNDLSLGNENNGFLKTGDIAFFDKNELFFIVGRISRFIKIFGNRINLDEVENLLLEKGLQTACKGHDNFLIIYVLKSDQMQFAIDFINKKLGIHLTAFEVRIIDEIPKSASGKILYSKLSD